MGHLYASAWADAADRTHNEQNVCAQLNRVTGAVKISRHIGQRSASSIAPKLCHGQSVESSTVIDINCPLLQSLLQGVFSNVMVVALGWVARQMSHKTYLWPRIRPFATNGVSGHAPLAAAGRLSLPHSEQQYSAARVSHSSPSSTHELP